MQSDTSYTWRRNTKLSLCVPVAAPLRLEFCSSVFKFKIYKFWFLNHFSPFLIIFWYKIYILKVFLSFFSNATNSSSGSVSETPKKSSKKTKKSADSMTKVYNSVLKTVFGAVSFLFLITFLQTRKVGVSQMLL